MSTTVTTESNVLAIEQASQGAGGGGGSSVANGRWPDDEPEVIPPGNQLPRTPAPSEVAALRKRAQESAAKKATSLAAASLAGLDTLAASTGRSVELTAAGEVPSQPPRMDAHGDSRGTPPPSQEPTGGVSSLYPNLSGMGEFDESEARGGAQDFESSERPMGTDEENTSQEFMIANSDLTPLPDDEDDDEDGTDVDDEMASAEEDDHTYYPVPEVNHRHVTDRRSKRSMHFPNRDLGQVDVLAGPHQEGPGAVANDQNVAVEAAMMDALLDPRGPYVIPKDPNGARRPVPPNVVTTAGRATAANRGRRAERGSTTKRAHSAGGTPASKARRGAGPPAGPPVPPPPGGGAGGNGGPPNPPPGPHRANNGGGGPGDPGNNPPGGGGGAPNPGGAAADQMNRYRKSIPSKLYEIPKLNDLSDTNFVSWLQKGNEN